MVAYAPLLTDDTVVAKYTPKPTNGATTQNYTPVLTDDNAPNWSAADEKLMGGGAAPESANKPASSRQKIRYIIIGGVTVIVMTILITCGIIKYTTYKRKEAHEASESHEEGPHSSNIVLGGPLTGPSLTSKQVMSQFPDLRNLLVGNRQFQNESELEHPGLIKELAAKQHPEFAYLGCADSRVPPTTVLNAKIGDLFVERNVGNQYKINDLNTQTVMTYAISHLKVKHLIVMGHYGCGAVQAAIASPSHDVFHELAATRVESWISPIRLLYQTSNRTEIVAFREEHKDDHTIEGPDQTEPAFRALVEENVKAQVTTLASDPVVVEAWEAYLKASTNMTDHGTTSDKKSPEGVVESPPNSSSEHQKRSTEDAEVVALWIHGWVYDVATGLVTDLEISRGPSSLDTEE